eukprot:3090287-Rhodomonas_salina.1
MHEIFALIIFNKCLITSKGLKGPFSGCTAHLLVLASQSLVECRMSRMHLSTTARQQPSQHKVAFITCFSRISLDLNSCLQCCTFLEIAKGHLHCCAAAACCCAWWLLLFSALGCLWVAFVPNASCWYKEVLVTQSPHVTEALCEDPLASMLEDWFHPALQSLLGYLSPTNESEAEFGEFCDKCPSPMAKS